MASPTFPCSNCLEKEATIACSKCLLVAYCSGECQEAHASRHRADCKVESFGTAWQPSWMRERRLPTFVDPDHVHKATPTLKFLWGNVPGFDVLRLADNEGEGYAKDISILFAASGDPRSAITTVAALPPNYAGNLRVVLNDNDLDVVARNIILLLIAFAVEDRDQAVDCMIHVWYSALVRQSDLDILQDKIRPLIETAIADNEKAEQEGNGKQKENLTFERRWTFGRRTLKVVLDKSQWSRLLTFVEIPNGLAKKRARKLRHAVTLSKDVEKLDIRERDLCNMTPTERLTITRFWEEGLLLPFGAPRQAFQLPNPTIYQDDQSWPMDECATPTLGWNEVAVAQTSCGCATEDRYGKLFYHIRSSLRAFIDRAKDLDVRFELSCVNARNLGETLEKGTFTRIDVSNISDRGYLGPYTVLETMMPLLQSEADNPHATLITLFMNAAREAATDSEKAVPVQRYSQEERRLLQYLRRPPSNNFIDHGIENTKWYTGTSFVVDNEPSFQRWCKKLKLAELGEWVGAAMKEKHTIVEKWPNSLKLDPSTQEGKAEFQRRLSSIMSGYERYVEWTRAPQVRDEKPVPEITASRPQFDVTGNGPASLTLRSREDGSELNLRALQQLLSSGQPMRGPNIQVAPNSSGGGLVIEGPGAGNVVVKNFDDELDRWEEEQKLKKKNKKQLRR